MHGQHGANGQQADKDKPPAQRHACPVPSSPRPSALVESTSRKSYTTKDGRKIDIGDCALFQAGDAPPFIGILRKVTVDKDNSVRLRVNWLYRPADVKLARGAPSDFAPNEIFYSFHKDDTPAASLLHPCKVAFLRKGVELPSGVSSFVCRRVYDIAQKRLWWLTDRDYTDEHQEEVDQLLNRTKLEMQAAIQQPGKGKKRERSDSTHEPSSKRAKADDSESSFVKLDRNSPKPEEITSITDKDGGLSNLAGVEKLVNLMQQDRNDGTRKPIDVASRRIMLASVVASTDKQECRDRLVQLGGLAVLDDWLQEAHKGKSGDGGGNPVEVDKVLDDLLLTLLRALQKLPVDLDALKTYAVGKSVNNLKNHKNVEIQKKARKLVETWKKRVDAEMKQSGEKPGTPGKQGSGDPLQSLSSAKDAKKLAANGPADAPAKSVGSATSKSGTTASSKENSPNNSGSNEVQGLSVKEEKSCASQAQNYGPTWSSAPVTSACKEEVKPVSKSTRSSQAKADPSSGIQKENGSVKSVMWSRTNTSSAERPAGSDKPSGETETPPNQRLILRFPNPGKSPARANGDSQAKVSSPKVLDRSSSSGLGDGAGGGQGKSKHHNTEISSEKRHKSEGKGGDKAGGGGDKPATEGRQQQNSGKPSDKPTRENHSTSNGVEGGMSLLATVAADEILKCDGSCVTVSTGRSVVTEEGNLEQDNNIGTSSTCPEHPPSSEQQERGEADREHLTEGPMKKGSLKEGFQDTSKEDLRRQNSHDASSELPSSRKAEISEEANRKSEPELSRRSSDAQKQKLLAEKREEARDTLKTEAVKSGGSPVSPEEDALEVARQVAKEIEEEVEGYTKPRSSEADAAMKAEPPEEPPPPLAKAAVAECENISEQKATPDAVQAAEVQPSTPQCAPGQEVQVAEAREAGEGPSRPLFDLNEGFPAEEGADGTGQPPLAPSNPVPVSPLTAPIPVMASTIGSFIPPASALKANKEAGWKGSAATSAFRPAEPRAVQEKKGKPLEFDLNVADGEDAGLSSSTDVDTAGAARSFLSSFPSTSAAVPPEKKGLDLNQVNESEEGGSLRLRPPGMSSSSGNVHTLRNFDLNDGPAFEESPGGEDVLLRNINKPKTNQMAPSGNMNGELLNLSSWFTQGSSFPSVGIPGFSSTRTDQPAAYSLATATTNSTQQQHPFVNGAGTFASDLYRAAAAGPSSTLGYQANPQALYSSYPGFPFGSSFPFSSGSTFVTPSSYVGSSIPGSFSTITSQQVVNNPAAAAAAAAAAVSAFARPPYFMGVTETGSVNAPSTVGVDATAGSWGRRSLDLNAGPESGMAAAVNLGDSEVSRQQQQAYGIPLDESMRAFHQAGANLKRKEPETGWDVYRGGFKWR